MLHFNYNIFIINIGSSINEENKFQLALITPNGLGKLLHIFVERPLIFLLVYYR